MKNKSIEKINLQTFQSSEIKEFTDASLANLSDGYSTPKYTTIPLQSAPVIPGQSTPL